MMIAAPLTRDPGLSWSRVYTFALCQAPAEKNWVRSAGFGSLARDRFTDFSLNFAPPPTASTDTASTTNRFARSTNPKRAVWAFSNARSITAALPAGTIRVDGGSMCAHLAGLPFTPCFRVEKIDYRSFRGSLAGLSFAYCDFYQRNPRSHLISSSAEQSSATTPVDNMRPALRPSLAQ